MSFGRMPFGWIVSGLLHPFSGARGMAGTEIVALKCYLAIAAYHDAQHDETVLSIRDFMLITKASKPTILRGLKLLEEAGLLTVDPRADRNTNVYVLGNTDAGFRKVPQDLIVKTLKQVGNRGAVPLAALKLYIALLYHRNEGDNYARVSHRTLVSETGVRAEHVKPAYKMLHTHGLLTAHISAEIDERSPSGHPTNAYELHGDFKGKLPKELRPLDASNQIRRREARGARAANDDWVSEL